MQDWFKPVLISSLPTHIIWFLPLTFHHTSKGQQWLQHHQFFFSLSVLIRLQHSIIKTQSLLHEILISFALVVFHHLGYPLTSLINISLSSLLICNSPNTPQGFPLPLLFLNLLFGKTHQHSRTGIISIMIPTQNSLLSFPTSSLNAFWTVSAG